MTILDCHSPESAIASLAEIIGEPADRLSAKLSAFRPDEWQGDPPCWLWENVVGQPRRFAGVKWFHASRSLSPNAFAENGIWPLTRAIDSIWDSIFDLIGDRRSSAEKLAFRQRVETDGEFWPAELYQLKLAERHHWGPFALLVRETALNPREISFHDYLAAPEIVEDICQCYQEWHGDNLFARFHSRSVPVIVSFVDATEWPGALEAALMYVWTKLQGERLGINCNTCFNADGISVVTSQIINVEILD